MAEVEKLNEDDLEEDEDNESQKEEVDPDTLDNGSRTIVVGEWSTVTTISEGLARCQPGDLLWVSAGQYDEKVTLDKDSVDIRGPVEMSAVIKHGIVSTCSFTTVTTVCVEGGVEVKCGNLSLLECDISSADIGIRVHRMAIPTVTSCTLHHLRRFHICVHPGGMGEYTQNTLTGSGLPNVVGLYLDDSESVTFSKNTISEMLTGVYTIHGCRAAVVEENTIRGIQGHGIYVDQESKPTFKSNDIRECEHYGILVSGNSSGAVFSQNLIFASVRVRAGCRPSFYGNFVAAPAGKVIRDEEVLVLQGITFKTEEEMLKMKKKPPAPEDDAEGEDAA